MGKTAPEAASQTPGSLKIEQAAALLRLSARRINQLIQEGWIRRDGNGALTVVAVVHGYLDFKDEELKRMQQKAADNEVRRAKAREINIRIAERERALCQVEDALDFVGTLIGAIVALLVGLPARFTRDVNERRRLEKLVSEIRDEVANLAAKLGQAFRTGGELTEAAGEDDTG